MSHSDASPGSPTEPQGAWPLLRGRVIAQPDPLKGNRCRPGRVGRRRLTLLKMQEVAVGTIQRFAVAAISE